MCGSSPRMTGSCKRCRDSLSSLAELFRLLTIVPPCFRYGERIAGLLRRPTEHVPVCEPMGCLVPVRNPITPAADDPIESLAGGHHARPTVGGDDAFDQRIDDRIRD